MNIHDTIMEKYQARRTKKQKTAFIDYLKGEIPGLRMEEAGGPGGRNLIYGDVEKAEVIFTAHYDTVIESFLPNLILPYSPVLKFAYALLMIVPMVIAAFAVDKLLVAFGADDFVAYNFGLAAYFAVFAFTFLIGKANRHTANDNTSGVLALIKLIGSLSAEEHGKCAFVFFDNEEYGCLGSGAFYKKHKDAMQDKLIFNMDCIGDGDNILFVLTKVAQEKFGGRMRRAFIEKDGYAVHFADSKKVKYPSDQKHFPVSAAVSALHSHKRLKLWVGRIHTRRDTVCIKENIEYVCEGAKKMLDPDL